LDLSDLLIFKTVAEESGILRAARKLHRVPSNVTTRIKQLETSIGTELFPLTLECRRARKFRAFDFSEGPPALCTHPTSAVLCDAW
jgi:Bacterial regulatory helix-turn-helix protein, lysR family